MKKQQTYAIVVSVMVALIMAVASGPARATLVTLDNPSFETPDASGGGLATIYFFNGALGLWTHGNVTVLNNTFSGSDQTHSVAAGTQWLQLVSVGAPASISQTFNTTLGNTYEVSFWYEAMNDGTHSLYSMSYDVGGTPQSLSIDATGVPGGSMTAWNQQVFTFTAAGPTTTLTFAGTGLVNSFYGPGVDDVMVNDLGNPEPTTCVLLLVGGGLIVGRRRKK